MIAKVVAALIAPLGTALVLLVLALIVRPPAAAHGTGRRPRLASFAIVCATAWLWLWSTPLASDTLRGWIEAHAGERTIGAIPTAPVAVVLGGGVAGPRLPRRPYPDMTAAADRLWYAARLYHTGTVRRLLLSGGTVRGGDGTEADAMRQLLHDFGVPDSVILAEATSTTTGENATHTAQLLRAQRVDTVLLVTSALHMPRARALLARTGLTVIPAPTDFEVVEMPFDMLRLVPTADALDGSGRAFKELLGWALAAL